MNGQHTTGTASNDDWIVVPKTAKLLSGIRTPCARILDG